MVLRNPDKIPGKALEALALERRNGRYMDVTMALHDLGGMDGEAMHKYWRKVFMWYVMQVIAGQENQTAMLVEKLASERILKNCFIPVRRLRKKFHGSWHEVTEKLFPGYVFLITEQPRLLYEELKEVPALTRMLGRYGEYFTPLHKEDICLLKKIQMTEMGLSKVKVNERSQIQILSGPLKELELDGRIKKMNLHKRIALVEMEILGNKRVVHMGIEIVNSSDSMSVGGA